MRCAVLFCLSPMLAFASTVQAMQASSLLLSFTQERISISVSFVGSGLSANTGITCMSVACRQRATLIAGSITGAGIALVLVGIIVFGCCRHWRGRPRQNNATFVNTAHQRNPTQQIFDMTMFRSGSWYSRYLYYAKWHGPDHCSLSFDRQQSTVTGAGSDDLGAFTVTGIFSAQTGRMGLTKTYSPDTIAYGLVQPKHEITIQLIWHSHTRQFEGKWYVQTKKYRGENQFILKFNPQLQSQQQQQQQLFLHQTL